MADDVDVIATRLNTYPPRWMGCTQNEIVRYALGSLITGFILCGIIGALYFGGGFGFVLGGSAGFLVGSGLMLLVLKIVAHIKRKRPHGFVNQRFRIVCHKIGIKRSPYILRSGSWFLGRRL